MLIGELAKRCEVSIDTVRYYEKQGLLSKVQRAPSGYRVYGKKNLIELAFVLNAKKLGFTLNEITELLEIRVEKADRHCAEVKQLVEDKQAVVEAKIAELEKIRQALKTMAEDCCGGDEPAVYCSILEALEN